MIIKDWNTFENFLAEDLKFRKTKASGAVFGDCDLKGKIGSQNVTIECKYTNRLNLFLNVKDYFKAKAQSKSRTPILALGNKRHILFFFHPQLIPTPLLFKLTIEQKLISAVYDLSSAKSKQLDSLTLDSIVLIDNDLYTGMFFLFTYKSFKNLINKIEQFYKDNPE
jgi:hypothetical protein